MRFFLSLFQTTEGGPHWISILTFAGWLVTGGFIISSLVVNRNDRVAQGPWILTTDQDAQLAKNSKEAVKGKVAIEYSGADTKRVRGLALQLAEIFKRSGYDVWGYVGAFIQTSGDPVTGLRVEIVKDQPSDQVGGGIQKALIAAGFDVPGQIRRNNNYEPDTALVIVGAKPNP